METFNNFKQLLKFFKDESKCREYLEQQRWNGTPVCPHCKNVGAYKLKDGKTYKCKNSECYKKFTVTVGTIYENGKLPLSTWFAAIYLATAHKKGISSYQLSRDLGITQKSAWFVLHRIREMVKQKNGTILSNTIECDETYTGGKISNQHKEKRVNKHLYKSGMSDKTAVFAMLERGGNVVAMNVGLNPNTEILQPIIEGQTDKQATIITDGFGAYRNLKKSRKHEVVNHSQEEYVRGEFHTNSVEGFFALLKRGIYGIYHQTSSKHLQRYCDEFAYRYNTRKITDNERFILSLQNSNGRLKYKDLIRKTGNEKTKEIQ